MNDDVIAQLESQKREIEKWQNNPLTQKLAADNKEEQDKAVRLICNNDIVDLETFFAHFIAVGHLRGLRRGFGVIEDELDGINQQLKEYK